MGKDKEEHQRERYEIRVTEDHIRRGYPCDCRSCPVALAISEQTPYVASVNGLVVLLTERDVPAGTRLTGWTHAALPPEALAFVEAFDYVQDPTTDRLPDPFSFVLVVGSLPQD